MTAARLVATGRQNGAGGGKVQRRGSPERKEAADFRQRPKSREETPKEGYDRRQAPCRNANINCATHNHKREDRMAAMR